MRAQGIRRGQIIDALCTGFPKRSMYALPLILKPPTRLTLKIPVSLLHITMGKFSAQGERGEISEKGCFIVEISEKDGFTAAWTLWICAVLTCCQLHLCNRAFLQRHLRVSTTDDTETLPRVAS